jgi:hypothetical protein
MSLISNLANEAVEQKIYAEGKESTRDVRMRRPLTVA